ncbi:DUF6320 domain-containing protein [Dehalobacter sp. DCM]|uniref:DUF6320 domain-containing protein n=1 Tax=Dehalobacter sp. DCM TaxID=2907827 RepID=UPI0030817965|nr:DUF6320 domain-containing protein [Dehalobacter sp. DCM]
MLYCVDCKITISAKTNHCPLCHRELEAICSEDLEKTYPVFERLKKKDSKLTKTISFVSVFLIASSVVANKVTWSGNLWSVIFSSCVLYAWLLGLFTFAKRVHLGLKLIGHAIAIPLLLVVVNAFAYDTQTINRVSWALSYAMPFIFICFIIAINIIMFSSQKNWRDFLIYQLSLCVLGFIPLILVLSGIAQPMTPSIIAAIFSYLTIICMAILAKKIVREELIRKFHL